MNWRHTKLGRYVWTRFWYRVDWYIGERRLHRWIKYAQKHNMFVKITNDYLMIMDESLKKSARITNIFRPYDRWHGGPLKPK